MPPCHPAERIPLHQLTQLYDLPYADVMRLIGYPVPSDREETISQSGLAARIGPVTEEEEEELIDYLKFLRSKRKGKDI
jgi:HTH-type transcriptional regulator, competence development regulator